MLLFYLLVTLYTTCCATACTTHRYTITPEEASQKTWALIDQATPLSSSPLAPLSDPSVSEKHCQITERLQHQQKWVKLFQEIATLYILKTAGSADPDEKRAELQTCMLQAAQTKRTSAFLSPFYKDQVALIAILIDQVERLSKLNVRVFYGPAKMSSQVTLMSERIAIVMVPSDINAYAHKNFLNDLFINTYRDLSTHLLADQFSGTLEVDTLGALTVQKAQLIMPWLEDSQQSFADLGITKHQQFRARVAFHKVIRHPFAMPPGVPDFETKNLDTFEDDLKTLCPRILGPHTLTDVLKNLPQLELNICYPRHSDWWPSHGIIHHVPPQNFQNFLLQVMSFVMMEFFQRFSQFKTLTLSRPGLLPDDIRFSCLTGPHPTFVMAAVSATHFLALFPTKQAISSTTSADDLLTLLTALAESGQKTLAESRKTGRQVLPQKAFLSSTHRYCAKATHLWQS